MTSTTFFPTPRDFLLKHLIGGGVGSGINNNVLSSPVYTRQLVTYINQMLATILDEDESSSSSSPLPPLRFESLADDLRSGVWLCLAVDILSSSSCLCCRRATTQALCERNLESALSIIWRQGGVPPQHIIPASAIYSCCSASSASCVPLTTVLHEMVHVFILRGRRCKIAKEMTQHMLPWYWRLWCAYNKNNNGTHNNIPPEDIIYSRLRDGSLWIQMLHALGLVDDDEINININNNDNNLIRIGENLSLVYAVLEELIDFQPLYFKNVREFVRHENSLFVWLQALALYHAFADDVEEVLLLGREEGCCELKDVDEENEDRENHNDHYHHHYGSRSGGAALVVNISKQHNKNNNMSTELRCWENVAEIDGRRKRSKSKSSDPDGGDDIEDDSLLLDMSSLRELVEEASQPPVPPPNKMTAYERALLTSNLNNNNNNKTKQQKKQRGSSSPSAKSSSFVCTCPSLADLTHPDNNNVVEKENNGHHVGGFVANNNNNNNN
eukprot:PhM_4_TR8413/c2_g2_i1/m.8096